MRLTLPDDLADDILQRMPTGREVLFETTVHRVLKAALPLITEGGLAISRDDLEKLAGILQRPSLGSAEQILDATRDLCDLSIGRHKLTLPPAVLNELRARAGREGRDFGQLLQERVNQISEQMESYV